MWDAIERTESILWGKAAMYGWGLELSFEEESIRKPDIGRNNKRVFLGIGVAFNCDSNDLLDIWQSKEQVS